MASAGTPENGSRATSISLEPYSKQRPQARIKIATISEFNGTKRILAEELSPIAKNGANNATGSLWKE